MKKSLLAATLATALVASTLAAPVAGAATVSQQGQKGTCRVEFSEALFVEQLYEEYECGRFLYSSEDPGAGEFVDMLMAMPGMEEKLRNDFKPRDDLSYGESQEMRDEVEAIWKEKGQELDPAGAYIYVLFYVLATRVIYEEALKVRNGQESLVLGQREDAITVKPSDRPSIDYTDFDRGQPADLQETYAKEIAHVKKGLLAYYTAQDETVKLCKQNQGGTVDFPSGTYEWIILRDSQAPEFSDGAIAGIVLGAFIAPQVGIVLPTLPHMYTS